MLLLAERPGDRRVAHLLDARRPKVDAVVVIRMDRLGRDAAEQIDLLKLFRTGKVGVVAITQQIDLATPHGRDTNTDQMRPRDDRYAKEGYAETSENIIGERSW